MRTTPRRVVTGLDAQGRSCILFDGPSKDVGSSSTTTALLWTTCETPVDNGGTRDQVDRFSMQLPPGGTAFVMTEMMPGDGLVGPGMHATDTIDYGIVLSGRIALLVETGEVELAAGDVFVDRGVKHGWCVLGDEPARIGVVMIDAAPLSLPWRAPSHMCGTAAGGETAADDVHRQ